MESRLQVPIVDVPDGPRGLTPEWLTLALRRGGGVDANASVEATRAEVIGTDRGIGGQVARIHIEYAPAGAGPATLVAKMPSDDERNRSGGRFLRFPQREVGFYLEVAPTLPMHTPRCHFGAVDDDGDNFILLLEDMDYARGGDDLVGCTDAEAEAAIDALAAMHAACWRSPLLEAVGWMPAIGQIDPGRVRVYTLALREARDLGERVAHLVPTESQPLLDEIAPRFADVIERLGRAPQTLVHGDFRLDNLFFPRNEEGAPPTAIDWSNAMRGPGPYDVAYLVSAAFEPERRRGSEERLLRRYHEGLLAGGVEGYTYDDCFDDYRLSFIEPLARMLFLIIRGHSRPGHRVTRILERAVHNAALAAGDLRAIEVLER